MLPIETRRRKEFLPMKGWPPGKAAGEREREREREREGEVCNGMSLTLETVCELRMVGAHARGRSNRSVVAAALFSDLSRE